MGFFHKLKRAGQHAGRLAVWIRLYSSMSDNDLKLEQDEIRRNEFMSDKERGERLRAMDEARALRKLRG